jgi:hypothetical protein
MFRQSNKLILLKPLLVVCDYSTSTANIRQMPAIIKQYYGEMLAIPYVGDKVSRHISP